MAENTAASKPQIQAESPWAAHEEKAKVPHKSGPKRTSGKTPALPLTSSGKTSLDFDASRRTMNLHYKFGHRESLTGQKAQPSGIRPGSWMDVFRGSHIKQAFRLSRIAPGEKGSLSSDKSLKLLQQSVKVTEEHYQRGISLAAGDATVMGKTQPGLEGVAIAPSELLGVSLDDNAIRVAEGLGYKASQVLKKDDGTSVVRLTLPPEVNPIRAQADLAHAIPGIQFETNKLYRLYRASMYHQLETPKAGPAETSVSAPCDTDRCYYRNLIHWHDALGECATGLKVGVIDTGIDFAHPALKTVQHDSASMTGGRSPAPGWHGTGVLALLAGNPASDTPGLIPGAHFYTADIFYLEEGGTMTTDTFSLLNALDWMNKNEVDIINMSFSGPPDELVKGSIEELARKGVVLVAAAGNEGPLAEPVYPAAYPEVIAVTAVTKDRHNYWYANRGRHIDIAEPGVDIWTAVPGSGAGFHSGTSFAAPFATAIISLRLSEMTQETRSKKSEVLANLPYVDLGQAGRDEVYGRGLLTAPSFCGLSNEVASAAQDGPVSARLTTVASH
jgi:hypothetical protein